MRICFVTSRFPFPLDKGDKTRAYQQIRHLAERHDITLIAASHETVSEGDIAALRPYCERIEIVPIRKAALPFVIAGGVISGLPLQVAYFSSRDFKARVHAILSSDRFDILHASLPRVLPAVSNVRGVPIFVDLMDAFSLSVHTRMTRAPRSHRWLYRLERDRLVKLERSCTRFSGVAVTSCIDRDYLESSNIVYVPQGVDLDNFSPPDVSPTRNLVVMTGNMGYAPNVDAVVWFVRSVWPGVLKRVPQSRFLIAGARPSPKVRALDDQPGVSVSGPVPNMADVLRSATVAVCPMRSGSGIQTKLLEAMAVGVPCVSTTLGNAGVAARSGAHLSIADSASTFSDAIVELLTDPDLRNSYSKAGRLHVEQHFSWRAHAVALEFHYDMAMRDHKSSYALTSVAQ